MKWKEALGICIGILFFAAAIYGLILGSKDDQKGRTEPVAQFSWQKATFANEDLNKIVEDMQLKYIHGFLFRKDSLTPVYYPVYIGKSAKDADAVKKMMDEVKIEVAFIDGVQHMILDGEDVTFKLAGPTRAGLIVPAEQPEKEEVVMLLMPMLVND